MMTANSATEPSAHATAPAAPPNESFAFDVEDLRADHAPQLADLHERCFQGYFLTLMGRGVLERYYAEFARHSFDYGCVARSRATKELVALAVGSADVQAHTRAFVRRNFVYLSLAVLWRTIINSAARKAVLERAGRVLALSQWMLPWRKTEVKPATEPRPEDNAPVRFLSMGIDPTWRRSLASIAVVRRFEDLLRKAGHRRFGSSIFADNERAITFFTRMGYRVVKQTPAACWFEKDIKA